MKVNEVRIGNWVFDKNNKPQLIDEITRHPSCERNYEHILKFKGFNFANGYCEDLLPIPLTPEWLEKFGFEKENGLPEIIFPDKTNLKDSFLEDHFQYRKGELILNEKMGTPLGT